jgi:hypothetical protein
MSQKKKHYWFKQNGTFLTGALILLFGLIFPGIPELKANVCPEDLDYRVYSIDVLNVNPDIFRSFHVKQDAPVQPFTGKSPLNAGSSTPDDDQCYFKPGHRIFADKGPETALLAFSFIFFGYAPKPVSLIACLPFVVLATKTGNKLRIRPPPLS